MKTETIQEYLARGGVITIAKPGAEKYDHSAKYRKDSELNALRALKSTLTDQNQIALIEQAIDTRIQILKCTP